MTKLTYPKLSYRRLGLWTFKAKLHYYTDIPMGEINVWEDSQNMHIDFQVDLTQEQIDWIAALVADPNAQGPDPSLVVTNNTYVMYDIWERRDIIASACGFDFRIWWDTTGDLGPNVMDKIMFTPIGPDGSVKILSQPEKKALVDAIEDGNGWE